MPAAVYAAQQPTFRGGGGGGGGGGFQPSLKFNDKRNSMYI